ncbi:hypothetical protein [Prosthecobacter sp.]|uniref:hypothetical protein n=1 Tax=Prosthecobacter sp. TaxID=1965333 RepID=UPI0037852C00
MAGLLFGLLGCNYGTMTVGSYDGTTGKTSTKVYSKYYDNGTWLIKDKLGVVVLVDHEKKNIPVAHGVAQSLGALGPGDSVASGKVTVDLWNFDSVSHPVKFKRLLASGGELDFQNQLVTADPHAYTETPVGVIPISNYGTSVHVVLEVEVAGKPRRIELDLPRRTQQQLDQYFSKGAARPYPWGARTVSQ